MSINNEQVSELTENWPDFLNKNILDTLKNRFKFEKMTPVQSVVIPIFALKHKDVVVEAVTGSGKTLAFVIPIFEILLKREEKLKKHDIGALILSPTRELAIQIYEVVETIIKDFTQFSSILFVGGTNPADDMKKFQENGGHIIVCTVGRFEDLCKRKAENIHLPTHLKSLEVLILDEADRLLDLGFKESLNAIFQYLPKQRRTGLFSATQTDEIDKLIKAGLRNPCQIQVKQKGAAAKQKTPISLNNYFKIVEPNEKFYELISLLKNHKNAKHIIFMSTCACVHYFTKLLNMFIKNVQILALHRKIKDSKRNKVFADFKKLNKGILVCTDMLSRGIDVADVDWVIQYDLPSSASAFVHRCGRTARLERVGNALVFLLPNEDSYVNFIKINQNVPLEPFHFESKIKENENSNDLFKKIQQAASKEREIYEKGKEAFVSYIRAYTKHECSYLLRVKEIDFVNLAKGFGLLHLPKMPEIKKSLQYDNYDINYSTIPYKDKHREVERQKSIENGEFNKKKKQISKKSIAWSNNVERKLKKKIKREKKEIVEKKKRKEIDDDDYNDLEEDFKLLKKLKKKKISEKEFDEQFLPTDESDNNETVK